MTRLGDHIKIVNGFAFKSKHYVESGIRVLRITNVQKGEIVDHDSKFYSEDTLEKLKRYSLDAGDMLLSLTGNVGRVGKVQEKHLPAYVNQRVCKIRSDSPKLDEDFLFHLLNSDKFERDAILNSSGVAQLNLSTKWVENYEIELPPLETQRKIAAILDTADEYRQKTKALIDKYDELAQSLFLDMFGNLKGVKKPLSEVCIINPKKAEINHLSKNTKVSFVPMTNVSETGDLCLNINREMSEVWSGFTYFREDDVLFAKITPCMENGKGAVLKGLTSGIGFGSTEFHVLRPINNLTTSAFLFYLTNSKGFRRMAKNSMTGAGGQKRVPKGFLNSFKLIVPSVTLQNQFSNKVNTIKAQKKQAHSSLLQANELFNSLLQKAFKGEL